MPTPRIARIAVFALSFVALASIPAVGATANWPAYLFDNGHASFNPAATAITPRNANGVHKLWTFKPTKAVGQPPAKLMGAPVVVNGAVYIASYNGTLWALNETTGKVRWSANIGFTPVGTCSLKSGPTASPVVAPDPTRGDALTVYVPGGDGSLYALDATTGSLVWSAPIASTNASPAEFMYAAPLLVNGNLYVGVASNCVPPQAPGRLVELAQADGSIENIYHAVPADSGGASIWTSPVSDGTSVWVTTGNADQSGVEPAGDSFSFVRLAASDLSKQDIWTVTPSLNSTDFDFGSSPALFTATIAGRLTQMIGACNKNGSFYALAAQNLSAGPVWTRTIGTSLAGGPTCLASSIWDAAAGRLIVASNATTIGGVRFGGSLRSVAPATGASIWQRGVNPGPVEGSPSENGSGVIAAATAETTGRPNKLYLVDAATGRVLKKLALPAPAFTQPVFADRYLFAASTTGGLSAYGP